MNETPPANGPGYAAIVSYLPDPLRSYLHRLRNSLPGGHNPQAHITLLPPRLLTVPVNQAARHARATLRRFSAFAVELAAIRAFPGTNVLYVELGEGDATVRRLYEALNTDALAADEPFEFRPHLTISGPMGAHQLPAAQQLAETAWDAATCPRRFTLDEIVFLWLKPGCQNAEWSRLWSHRLKQAKSAVALTTQTY